LIIPYGAARLSERAIRAVDHDFVCAVPHVVIDRGTPAPLRMNNSGFDFRDAPPLHDLAGVDDQIAFVRAYLVSRCDIWSPAQRRFVERYFEFVGAQVEAHREALTAAIAPFGELYRLRDWVFSAWRPLPQAYLHAPAQAPHDPAQAPYHPDAMVPVDFAFWDGARLVAVVLSGSMSQTARRRRLLGQLRDSGALVIDVSIAALARTPDQVFVTQFPDPFARFWEGQRFPSGPFRPAGLRAEMR
jgi:hypothetical protein